MKNMPTVTDIVLLCLPLAVGLGIPRLARARSEPCQLTKSRFQPPGWAFGVAWAALYLLMGIAAVTFRRADTTDAAVGLGMFLVLLAGLQLWWLKFADGCGRGALPAIVALAAYAAFVTAKFYHASAAAGGCLAPLVAWLAFAAFLLADAPPPPPPPTPPQT
jgi:tryptophan-rich sensory protein